MGVRSGKDNIRQSIELGINKINVGSDFMKAQQQRCQQLLQQEPTIEYPTLIQQTVIAGKELVQQYIQLSGSTNKS